MFSESARQAFALAVDEAFAAGSTTVEPVHLFFALARDPRTLAASALARQQVSYETLCGSLASADLEAVCNEVLFGKGSYVPFSGAALPASERVRNVIRRLDERYGGEGITATTADLMLALLSETDVGDLIAQTGCDLVELRCALEVERS